MVLQTEGCSDYGTNANGQIKRQPFKQSQPTCYSVLQVLGTFGNGRIEAWIHKRPLKPEEMSQPRFSCCIAQRLAQFHAVNVKEPRDAELFKLILKWWGSAVDHQGADNPGQQAAACLSMSLMRRPTSHSQTCPTACIDFSACLFLACWGLARLHAVDLKERREPAC